MSVRVWLLVGTAALILVAASSFSIITGGPMHFEFYRCTYQSGWGTPFVSHYSLPRVVTYLLGYGLGLFAFASLRKGGLVAVGTVGLILCSLGALSFGIEATHWIFDHHRSLILDLPIVLLAVCLASGVQLWRRGDDAAPDRVARAS